MCNLLLLLLLLLVSRDSVAVPICNINPFFKYKLRQMHSLLFVLNVFKIHIFKKKE